MIAHKIDFYISLVYPNIKHNKSYSMQSCHDENKLHYTLDMVRRDVMRLSKKLNIKYISVNDIFRIAIALDKDTLIKLLTIDEILITDPYHKEKVPEPGLKIFLDNYAKLKLNNISILKKKLLKRIDQEIQFSVDELNTFITIVNTLVASKFWV